MKVSVEEINGKKCYSPKREEDYAIIKHMTGGHYALRKDELEKFQPLFDMHGVEVMIVEEEGLCRFTH